MSVITTHVLDTAAGKPASGINAELFKKNKSEWDLIAKGKTNNNGRISDLLKPEILPSKGIYKMRFDTGSYFKKNKKRCFYPYVEIIFEINGKEHYHIPLLLSPYGYTTYRGS